MLTLGKKQIAMAAGTFACALSIGMIMQSTGSAQRIYGKPPAVAEDPMLTVQDITLTAAEYEQAPDVDLMKDLPASGDADIDQLRCRSNNTSGGDGAFETGCALHAQRTGDGTSQWDDHHRNHQRGRQP